MIRKLLIILILCIMIYFCYFTVTSGVELGALKINSYTEVRDLSKNLDDKTTKLNKKNTDEFEEKKQLVKTVMNKYRTLKSEYETLSNGGQNGKYQSEEIYDIGYLWTMTGGYASKENLILQLDIYKSKLHTAHDVTTGDMSYTICDLDYTVYGQYQSIYDFLYDIEEDEKLGFEIRNIYVEKNPLRGAAPVAPKLPEDVITQKEWDKYLIDLKNYNDYPYPLKCKFSIIGIPVDKNTLSTLTPSVDADAVKEPVVEVEVKNSEFNKPRSDGNTNSNNSNTNTSTNTNKNTNTVTNSNKNKN